MPNIKIDLIAENLISIYPVLYKSISKPLRMQTSITPAGMFVLGILKRDGMHSMSAIGKCLSMPKPHVSVIIDKLIDEGYVIRQNDPNDRRIINISLTDKGLIDFKAINHAVSETLRVKLLLLSEEELEQLSAAALQVKEILITILGKE
jgi:DNA-binding MarR family transcriptional regulator